MVNSVEQGSPWDHMKPEALVGWVVDVSKTVGSLI